MLAFRPISDCNKKSFKLSKNLGLHAPTCPFSFILVSHEIISFFPSLKFGLNRTELCLSGDIFSPPQSTLKYLIYNPYKLYVI